MFDIFHTMLPWVGWFKRRIVKPALSRHFHTMWCISTNSSHTGSSRKPSCEGPACITVSHYIWFDWNGYPLWSGTLRLSEPNFLQKKKSSDIMLVFQHLSGSLFFRKGWDFWNVLNGKNIKIYLIHLLRPLLTQQQNFHGNLIFPDTIVCDISK